MCVFFFCFFFSHVSNGDADHGIHVYMSVQTSLNIVIKNVLNSVINISDKVIPMEFY